MFWRAMWREMSDNRRLRFRIGSACAVVVAATALTLAAPAAAAKRTVPLGFYGTIWAGAVESAPPSVREQVWDRLAMGGVESVRDVFNWDSAQPRPDGPIRWGPTDAVVAATATRGMRLMPTVMYAPRWAKLYPGVTQSPPANPEDYAAFVAELVKRYGPQGSFWAEHPEVPQRPIRHWQIWNEPELTDHWWREGPWLPHEARRYSALLRAASRAARSVDPGAKIVLAGLTNASWETLAALYRRAGIRGHFDVAAVHPYSGHWRNVEIIVRLFRRTLDRFRDRAVPIWITEMTWPAAKGRAPIPPWADTPYFRSFVTTERDAARRLAGAYSVLGNARFRRRMRLERVHWYQATSSFAGDSIWSYVGLLRFDGFSTVAKPTYHAFRASARRREGCTKDRRGRCRR